MCTLCGCGAEPSPPLDSDRSHPEHVHPPGRDDLLGHRHATAAAGPGDQTVGGAARRIRIERDLFAENDRYAAANRSFLARRDAIAINLLSSPGSGKTTLLERTVADLRQRLPIAVIEGDQETTFDADRVRAAGVSAVQINTGKVCHLDAHMVGHALADLDPAAGAVVFIENVGNLVCPAAFDLGEAKKVVLLSVTEGDDKPRKYKDMFAVADLLVITKIDLLPYVRFDLARCHAFAEAVNPGIQMIHVSALEGTGLDAWYAWVAGCRPTIPEHSTPAAMTTV